MKHALVTFGAFEGLRIFQILGQLLPTRAAIHIYSRIHDIILAMTEDEENQNEEQELKGGQFLGCVFAAATVLFIFLVVVIFMRACS